MVYNIMIRNRLLNLCLIILLSIPLGIAGCSKKKVDSSAATAATVTGFSPTKISTDGGTLVTITGSDFVSGATVTIGGAACTNVTVVDVNTITCLTGAGTAGAGDVVVTNPGATGSTLASAATYVSSPTIDSISPSSGTLAGGTTMTIVGSGLSPNTTISVGGVACTPVVVNSTGTRATCTLGAGAAGSSAVVVSTPGGGSTSGPTYSYQAAPNPTSVDKTSVTTYGGVSVTVTGTGFLTGATVTVGGSSCTSVVVNSATSITCVIPGGLSAGAKNLVVTNTDAQSGTLASAITYKSIMLIAQGTPSLLAGTIITPSTGALTALANVATAGAITAVAVHPTLKIAYGAYVSNIAHFSINASTGALASTGAPVAGPSAPSGLVVTSDGKFAYACKNGASAGASGITAYTIDQTTGLLTAGATVTTAGVAAYGLAVSPDNKFLYVVYNGNSVIGVFSINSTTGALTLVSDTVSTGANPRAVAVDTQSKYVYTVHYAAGSNFVRFFTINQITGALTAVADYTLPGVATGSTSVVVTSGCLFVTNGATEKASSFVIGADGTLSNSASYTTEVGSAPSVIGVEPTNSYAYMGQPNGKIFGFSIGGSCTLIAQGGGAYTTDLTDPLGPFGFTAK